jgi:flagellar FliJ protein
VKKFKFSLETPLKIKQMVEDIEKQKLLKAIAKKEQKEKQLAELLAITRDAKHQLAHRLSENAKMADINSYDIYLYNLYHRLKEQQRKLKDAVKTCEHRRHTFLESKKNRQVLEKIRDTKLVVYNLNIIREEQKISDEITSVRYNRLEEN